MAPQVKFAAQSADSPLMESVYLRTRREFLLQNQNRDGGWGYFPGKQSWLEPTAYAALVLHGDPAAAKATALVLGWQNP